MWKFHQIIKIDIRLEPLSLFPPNLTPFSSHNLICSTFFGLVDKFSPNWHEYIFGTS